MIRVLPITIVLLTAAAAPASDFNSAPLVSVKATGRAPIWMDDARAAAVQHALQRSIAATAKLILESDGESAHAALMLDVLTANAGRFIKQHTIVAESTDIDLHTVELTAIVAREKLAIDIATFQSLLARKGRPRVLIVRSADGKPFESRLTAELSSVLQQRGVDVVDAERLTIQQTQAAERAAYGDSDPQLAATISQQVGADIYAIVDVQGESLPPSSIYGVEVHTVDVVGIVKLVRADTAAVLASEVVELRATADTPERATRSGASAALSEAMNNAARRIAMHWLEEAQFGRSVSCTIQKISTKRLATLVGGLRRLGAVLDIVIDASEPAGLSRLRIVTRTATLDLADAITAVDSKLQVVSATEHSIELK